MLKAQIEYKRDLGLIAMLDIIPNGGSDFCVKANCGLPTLSPKKV